VDDSVVIRRLITDAVGTEPMCEVVGSAANGKIALAKIPQVNPDIVTLDIEMPEMDGLQTLVEIRKAYPRLPVIMFSSLTERAAEATLKALSLGATDYVTKPSGATLEASIAQVRGQLLPKLRVFGAIATGAPRPAPAVVARPRAGPSAGPIDIVAIGCSTGGPNALTTVMEKLPPTLGVPVVIVQHMPPVFTRLLADRLRAQTGLRIHEARGGETLEPGAIWIAPGDNHMVVRREAAGRRLALHRGPPENSCRPAVDVLFRSVVESYRGNVLAIVMTGMGQDGLRGCEHVREAGGQIVVQDEPTSVVWGMPGAVATAGLADDIVPLEQIAVEISRRVSGRPRSGAVPELARIVGGPRP
jgi:two-component system chemotaxis response regulator CheB